MHPKLKLDLKFPAYTHEWILMELPHYSPLEMKDFRSIACRLLDIVERWLDWPVTGSGRSCGKLTDSSPWPVNRCISNIKRQGFPFKHWQSVRVTITLRVAVESYQRVWLLSIWCLSLGPIRDRPISHHK